MCTITESDSLEEEEENMTGNVFFKLLTLLS